MAQYGGAISSAIIMILTVAFIKWYYHKLSKELEKDDLEHKAFIEKLRATRRYVDQGTAAIEIKTDGKLIVLELNRPVNRLNLTHEQAAILVQEIVKRFSA